jgi:hypothetical protein
LKPTVKFAESVRGAVAVPVVTGVGVAGVIVLRVPALGAVVPPPSESR